MACESDKCEKYGLHHEYENGIEISKCFFCHRDEFHCEECKKEFLECSCFEMTKDEWEKIHKKFNSCAISMVMGYKHGRITASELMDLIEGYCESSYKLGTLNGLSRCKCKGFR